MKRFILFPEEVSEKSAVGGKAVQLSRLQKAGIAVPPSFFITVSAFDAFVESAGIASLLEAYGAAVKKGGEAEAAHLREKITDGLKYPELPAGIREELRDALLSFRKKGITKLAVRSSARGEDAQSSSFAGLFESILNVENDLNKISEAVRLVWRSGFDRRIGHYAQKKVLPDDWYRMGVIVQEMIHPRFSGVFFSVDPVSGEQNKALLEYTAGYAEQLVQGQVTPERCVVHHSDRRIVEGSPPDEADVSLLNRVIDLCFETQNKLGGAIDLEWAADERQVFILQARPITTTAGEDILWTDENVGEVIPDIVTPFSWSILEPITNEGFRWFLKRIGIKRYPRNGLFGLYEGKVYFNQTAFRSLLNRFYLSQTGRPISAPAKLLQLTRSLFAVSRLGLFSLTLPLRIKKFRQSHSRALRDVSFNEETEILPSLESVRRLLRLHNRNMALHISCTIVAELYYQMLAKLCSAWLADKKEFNADVLLAGLHAAESAESGRALWQIALKIKKTPSLRSLFEREDSVDLQQKLMELEEGRALLPDIEAFLDRYGHGALHEFELYYPRWWEDNRYIFKMLQTYVRSGSDLEQHQRETEQRRNKTRETALSRLHPPRKWFFKFILRRTEIFSTQRENLKQDFIRTHSELKKHLLHIGRTWQAEQRLDKADDILFFTIDEIEQQCGDASAQVINRDTAQIRMERRERQSAAPHPKKLLQRANRFIPLDEAETGASVSALKGIGCSAGVAEGRVKIIVDPANPDNLQKGDILVAVSTNPGWTPLFVPAAAVVTEIGGALSHGAIIAREYGLPMVTAVENVTTKLKDGMYIRVNGFNGQITILETTEKQ